MLIHHRRKTLDRWNELLGYPRIGGGRPRRNDVLHPRNTFGDAPMMVFHASDLRSLSGRACMQLGPYQFVLGSVMMVQPGDDEVQVIADDCGSLAVASLD